MDPDTDKPAGRFARARPVWWIIALSLALIAFNLTFRGPDLLPDAAAQSVQAAGARGIFAFSGPLTPTTSGVYMVDVDAGTIWCYEYVNVGGAKLLRLAAARSWIFDRYLEDYNTDEPKPKVVEQMIKQQRAGTQASLVP